MNNYTINVYKLKRKILNFGGKIAKGISKPAAKFLKETIYGLLTSNSVHLSDIGRALDEEISLKKTIDRLSRNLKNFTDLDETNHNYLNNVKKEIDEDTVFSIDMSEITKKSNNTKFESICHLRDGSTGEIRDGYYICEAAAVKKGNKMPLSVYSNLYSTEEKGFSSQNTEILKCLDNLTMNFGNQGIRALDRGFDNNRFYNYFLDNNQDFVVRCKTNRNVIYAGKSQNILKVAKKYKGKYRLDFHGKNGFQKLKISYIPVQLPSNRDKNLTLVVVYGLGKNPMMILTNMTSENKKIAVTITKVYLMRWQIEEYFRFKKQQFGFEDIRVRKFSSIKAMNALLSYAIGFIGLVSKEKETTIIGLEIIEKSKRIYSEKAKFLYYQIADGISNILDDAKVGIYYFLRKSKKLTKHRPTLFEINEYKGLWGKAI